MTARRALWCAALMAALPGAACGHGEPYALREVPPNTPLDSAMPHRLTYQADGAWSPEWLPDGGAIGFAYRLSEHAERDRCLGFMPATGGRVYRMICQTGVGEADTVNAVSSHAVSLGGRLAVVFDAGWKLLLAPARRGIYVQPLDGDDPPRLVLAFPYLASSGLVHAAGADLHWLDEQTIVFLAEAIQFSPPTPGVPGDTNDYGLEVAVLSLGGASPSVRVVPGTSGATAVAVDDANGQAYVTLAGDAHVYGLDLATGPTAPVADFAGIGVVRDVRVSNGHMVVVSGGRTRLEDPLLFGVAVQYDDGGDIWAVDLPGGAPRVVAQQSDRWFRNVALDPAGNRVVAEGFDVQRVPILVAGTLVRVDTIVARAANLWLIGSP